MIKLSQIKASRIRHASRYYCLCCMIWLASIALLVFALPSSAGATTPISQSYTSSEKLSLGSIVSIRDNTSDQVMAATSSNVDGLIGVVINAENSLLSLSSTKDNQVQVATNGTLQVLVSDINGDIVRGDHITASPISGVGMKATGNTRIVGTAQGSLGEAKGNKQSSYTDKDGVKHSVILGQIPVLINVSYYFKEPDKTLVPPALQNLANTFAGKTVSTLPIIISSIIFIITITVVTSIIYSMIRSSIISVGRNPMSQSAIYRDVIQLSALVLVILGIGIIAIYLVLTRM
jgi:hypothetical protein